MNYFQSNKKGFSTWANFLMGAVAVGFVGVTTTQSAYAISFSGD